MKEELARLFRCPKSGERLDLRVDRTQDGDILEGLLMSPRGDSYPISDGVPDYTYPPVLGASDREARAYYNASAETYDEYLPLTFSTFGEDETRIRREMIDALDAGDGDMVLELGAGTGRDSELIVERVGASGRLLLQDLSPEMLAKARSKLAGVKPEPAFFLSNASYLPLPDSCVDATYHFGGLNTFAEIGRAIREATRVTKPGGKVVLGDESVPPWLRDTEFGRVLMNSNPNYRFELPLEHLPIEARKTRIRWIIGEVFYVIDFAVGEGTPVADFDFEIPGARGGTHRTRYYGQLEGVTPRAKEIATEAARRSGKSMHRWLSDLIESAADEGMSK